MRRTSKPIPLVPFPDPPSPSKAWGFAVASALVCGPFLVAFALVGCAACVKAARMLYDVAVSLGAS